MIFKIFFQVAILLLFLLREKKKNDKNYTKNDILNNYLYFRENKEIF